VKKKKNKSLRKVSTSLNNVTSGFYPTKKTNIDTKTTRKKGTIEKQYKKDTEKHKKKGQTYLAKKQFDEWDIKNCSVFKEEYSLGHSYFISDEKYRLSSNATPKILPRNLGQIILNATSDWYKKKMFKYVEVKNFLERYEQNYQDCLINDNIPCIKIITEGESFRMGTIKINNLQEDINLPLPYGIFDGMKLYYNDNNCYFIIDSLNMSKLEECLKLNYLTTYIYSRQGVFKKNEYTEGIKTMFNTYRDTLTRKKGKPYIFFR